MKLMYNGKELQTILGPKYKTVLMWSTPLGGGGGGRGGGAGRGGPAREPRRLAAVAPPVRHPQHPARSPLILPRA